MLFRARRWFNRVRFNAVARPILQATALHQQRPDVTVLSMVGRAELRMYLVALYSFVQQLGYVPRIAILSDGSLRAEELALLPRHFPDAAFYEQPAFRSANCPVGGCWERLLLVATLAQESYIVQLDSDTLTQTAMPEVLAAIEANRSFTLLGDRSWPAIEPVTEAWPRYRGNDERMIQVVCERRLDEFARFGFDQYVRGNAGFTGFGKGSLTRERVDTAAGAIHAVAGEQWTEWGSEQFASNLLISNTEGALPLPFPAYASYWAHEGVDYGQSSLLHFIGPRRYHAGVYLRSVRRVLGQMRSSGRLPAR